MKLTDIKFADDADDMKFAEVKRAAWIRVGALGDLLVGLASLVETGALFPKARLTVVGPRLWCEILSPRKFPWIERIAVLEERKGQHVRMHTADRDGDTWCDGRRDETRGVLRVIDVFRDCEAVVNTNLDSLRYAFPALRAGVPIRFGAAPSTMAWVYTHCAPFFGKDPLLHERDAALLILDLAERGLARFTRTVSGNRGRLAEWSEASGLIGKWRSLGLPAAKDVDLGRARELTGFESGRYVLVNPTSSRREKAWPSARFLELMRAAREPLRARHDCEILVLGAPTETAWLYEAAGGGGGNRSSDGGEFTVVQPPSVRDLQDVLSGSRGLLTNTSSVQFIAAMTGTPTITLMGRAQPEIWGPLGPRDTIVRGKYHERREHDGCHARHKDIFQQEEESYASIRVEDVLPDFLSLPTRERVRVR